MLARNFLSAADLEVTEQERDALIRVLFALERGEIEYADIGDLAVSLRCGVGLVPTHFNMGTVQGRAAGNCGTVACICGWARYFAGSDKVFEYVGMSDREALCTLFLMGMCHKPDLMAIDVARWQKGLPILPQDAAQALSNFLTTGKSNWKQVVGE